MTSTGGIWIGVIGFLLGVGTTVLIVPRPRPPVTIAETATNEPSTPPDPRDGAIDAGRSISAEPRPRACRDDSAERVVRAEQRKPPTETDAVTYLRHRRLHLPVQGVEVKDLRSSFHEKRGGARTHEAIDILAPRGMPVEAVDDGCIARFFESRAGGLTIYQFDPTETYTYYYAHLDRYADELEEGDPVRRGQVVGYVGTTGNAPADTPHLHFAIFIMGDDRRWWEGTPIDPYEIWRSEPALPLN